VAKGFQDAGAADAIIGIYDLGKQIVGKLFPSLLLIIEANEAKRKDEKAKGEAAPTDLDTLIRRVADLPGIGGGTPFIDTSATPFARSIVTPISIGGGL
jgi:hypothetical protein